MGWFSEQVQWALCENVMNSVCILVRESRRKKVESEL